MLYCTIMAEKHTDNTKYKHSHKKNAKREVKYLTRSSVPDTIFSNQQPATSNQQPATSNQQQSGISAQSAQCTQNTHHFSQPIIRTGQDYRLRAFFYLLKICGHLRCRFAKNSPRRTKSTPAGVFCTLLASAPPIFKSSVSTGMDVGGCPTDWD